MKGIVWAGLLVTAALLSTGCGTDRAEQDHQHGNTALQKLTIEFATNPSPATVGTETELAATIFRVDEPVLDAKVEFEIWQGEGEHRTVEAKAGKNGVYTSLQTFTEPGTYHVQIHTTTKELHQMPTKQFEVVEK